MNLGLKFQALVCFNFGGGFWFISEDLIFSFFGGVFKLGKVCMKR